MAVFGSEVHRRCSDFVEWLESGGSMFWISGKPGSGKSSLIHYLSQQHRCSEILQQESAHQWHVIHFFFDYRSGKNKANSIEGMLRTLLAQLVQESIQISQYVASTAFGRYLHMDSDELACDTLRDTISRSIKSTDSRVCMFIDGLDEFEGVREELIPYLKELLDGGRVKLCVGCRPEPVFKQEFDKIPSINMQDFNYGSIADFAKEKFSGPAEDLSDPTNLLRDLVEQIAVDSSGVFLWAHLVCSDVVDGIRTRETISELQGRIASYPQELDQVYERLLRKPDTRFRPEIMVLLRLIDEPGRLSLIDPLVDLNYLCMSMQTLAKQGILDTYPRHYLSRPDFTERLKSRLGALVDIVDGNAVRLLHKTLHTFLEKSMNWTSNLPPKFQSTYPDEVWFRLSCRILTTSTLFQRLCHEQFVQFTYLLKEKCQQASTSEDGYRTRNSMELRRNRSEIFRVYSAKLNVFPDELATEFDATFEAMCEVESHIWCSRFLPRQRKHTTIFSELALGALMSKAYCLHPTQVVWHAESHPSFACFCQRSSPAKLLEFVQLPGPERALLFCLSHDYWEMCKMLLKNHKLQSPNLWEGIHRWLLENIMNDEGPSGSSPTRDGRRISTEPHTGPHRVSVMMHRGERFIRVFGRPAREQYCPAARSTFDNLQTSLDKYNALNALKTPGWQRREAMEWARSRYRKRRLPGEIQEEGKTGLRGC